MSLRSKIDNPVLILLSLYFPQIALTEAILMSLEKIFFIFYIGNNKNPPITEMVGPLKSVRAGVDCTSVLPSPGVDPDHRGESRHKVKMF